MRRQTVAATFVAALFPGLASSQVPVGPEFQVNTYSTGHQYTPRLAFDAVGNFVVTWSSYGQDGSGSGAFARRYDATGAPIGAAEFRLNVFTTGFQARQAVAAAPDGRLFFAWSSSSQDGDSFGIYARRFDAAGSPAGDEFGVNSFTSGQQRFPSIGADESGNFVVIWTDSGHDGSGRGVFGQRYDSAGAAQGPEFQVNSYTTGHQYNFAPAVAVSGNGTFVVVWESSGQDGSSLGIFAQRYDMAGVPDGSEFQVNVSTMSTQSAPSVASDHAGNFVVVWHSLAQPGGNSYDVVGRRYDASGIPQGGEFMVNTDTAGYQLYPRVAMDARGGFVVVWHGAGQYDSYDVFARPFDSSGPTGAQFRVGAYTGKQLATSVASNAAGDFVVAWQGNDDTVGSYGIFARRFLSDLIFKDHFESGNLSAWSANATDGGDLSVNAAAASRRQTYIGP